MRGLIAGTFQRVVCAAVVSKFSDEPSVKSIVFADGLKRKRDAIRVNINASGLLCAQHERIGRKVFSNTIDISSKGLEKEEILLNRFAQQVERNGQLAL